MLLIVGYLKSTIGHIRAGGTVQILPLESVLFAIGRRSDCRPTYNIMLLAGCRASSSIQLGVEEYIEILLLSSDIGCAVFHDAVDRH